jgi:hypothetical protein
MADATPAGPTFEMRERQPLGRAAPCSTRSPHLPVPTVPEKEKA